MASLRHATSVGKQSYDTLDTEDFESIHTIDDFENDGGSRKHFKNTNTQLNADPYAELILQMY